MIINNLTIDLIQKMTTLATEIEAVVGRLQEEKADLVNSAYKPVFYTFNISLLVHVWNTAKDIEEAMKEAFVCIIVSTISHPLSRSDYIIFSRIPCSNQSCAWGGV